MRRAGCGALAALLAAAAPAPAQVSVGFQATPVLTRADPVPGDSALTRLTLSAPLAFASASMAGGRVLIHAMLDGEGWTMRNGQLGPGAWGEGFYDLRHPHTLVHELMASTTDPVAVRGLRWSLALGKGFAPFGSDDPMSRPALLYPVNHHWAQVLERAVAIVGVSRGAITLEGGLFDGDEPESYTSWPDLGRFGDSWSVRALVRPAPAIELQASHADVASPEDRSGAGPANRKTSLSARYQRQLGPGVLYALGEWTANAESSGVDFHSVLLEAEFRHGGHRHYARFELSDRPEERRLAGDPFRSPRPPTDSSLIGITRWRTLTAGSAFALPSPGALHTELIGEIGWSHVTGVSGSFDPAAFYGRSDLLSFSLALRLSYGMAMHRMGRYGVAALEAGMPAMAPMPGMSR